MKKLLREQLVFTTCVYTIVVEFDTINVIFSAFPVQDATRNSDLSDFSRMTTNFGMQAGSESSYCLTGLSEFSTLLTNEVVIEITKEDI